MNTSFFILAGGYGIRAKPLSLFKPKPVFPLNGTPLINLLLKQLDNDIFINGYVNLHYLPEKLKKPIKYSKKLNYIHEENLSGSAVLNLDYIHEEFVLIINGDVFQEIPVYDLINKIKDTNADGVLLIKDDPENNYSKLIINDDKFSGIAGGENTSEKMYASIAIFKTNVIKQFNDKNFFISLMKNNFDIRVLDYNNIWLELGNPRSYHYSVFNYIEHLGIKKDNSFSDTTNISDNSIVKRSITWDNVCINSSNISNSIILDDVTVDNMEISNKIVFNLNDKLTLIDL